MKHLSIFLVLCFFSLSLLSQNYYVAIVKGNVYYQNKLLKKRDKISIKGQLKFSSATDYVKLSGPGGLYTITAAEGTENANNEFLLAVTNDLFPSIRLRATSAMNIVADYSHYFSLQGISYTFFEETEFYIREDLLSQEGLQLAFLHQTDQGLFQQIATIKDNNLILKESDFDIRIGGRKANPITISRTAIIQIRNAQEWQETLSGKQTIEDIEPFADRYGEYYAVIPITQVIIDTLGNRTEVEVEPELKAIQILDYLGSTRFVAQKAFVKDMRFNIRKCKPINQEEFLFTYFFDDYIEEKYGYIYGPSFYTVFKDKIKLTDHYDDVVEPDFIELDN